MGKQQKSKPLLLATGIVVIVVAVAVCILLVTKGRKPEMSFAEASYGSEYAGTVGEFTAKTASTLLRDKQMNTCYSPASLFGVVTMLAQTTEEDTQTEILQCLALEDMQSLEEVYGKLQRHTSVDGKNSEIRLDNGIWVRGVELNKQAESILSACEEKTGCSVHYNDGNDAEDVRNWMAKHADGQIVESVETDPSSTVTMVNACYLKDAWKHEFERIGMQKFHLCDGESIQAEYIECQGKSMSYKEMSGCQIVSVPMCSGRIVFLLPDEEHQLEEFLTEENINGLLATVTGYGLEDAKVTIRLPEYEIVNTYGTEIADTLEMLGVHVRNGAVKFAFTDEELQLGPYFYQAAKIKVNEQGVEASAVTKAEMIPLALDDEEKEVEITLNRPFLYVVLKNETPLFVGTVYNPEG